MKEVLGRMKNSDCTKIHNSTCSCSCICWLTAGMYGCSITERRHTMFAHSAFKHVQMACLVTISYWDKLVQHNCVLSLQIRLLAQGLLSNTLPFDPQTDSHVYTNFDVDKQ